MTRTLTSIGSVALAVALTAPVGAMPSETSKSGAELIVHNRLKPKIPSWLFVKKHPRRSAAMLLVHTASHITKASRSVVDAYQVALTTAFGTLSRAEVNGIAKQVEAIRRTAGQNAEDVHRYTKATADLLERHHPSGKGAKGADPLDMYSVPRQAIHRELTLEQAVQVIHRALPRLKK